MMFELTMAELKTAFREGDKSWILVAIATILTRNHSLTTTECQKVINTNSTLPSTPA